MGSSMCELVSLALVKVKADFKVNALNHCGNSAFYFWN